MRKTIGLDLGTNSIGLSIRDIERGSNIIAQLEYFNSVIFKSGVGKEKNAEFSFAAKRTEKRQEDCIKHGNTGFGQRSNC